MALHLCISFEQIGNLSVSSVFVNCATQVGDSPDPNYPRLFQLSCLVFNSPHSSQKDLGYLGRAVRRLNSKELPRRATSQSFIKSTMIQTFASAVILLVANLVLLAAFLVVSGFLR